MGMKRTPPGPERLSGEAGLRTYIPQKIFLKLVVSCMNSYLLCWRLVAAIVLIEMQYDEAIAQWQINQIDLEEEQIKLM